MVAVAVQHDVVAERKEWTCLKRRRKNGFKVEEDGRVYI